LKRFRTAFLLMSLALSSAFGATKDAAQAGEVATAPEIVPAGAVAPASAALATTEADSGKLDFTEVWAYLMDGEEAFLDPSLPVTDLGYFGAGIGISGNLMGVPSRDKLPAFKGRVHADKKPSQFFYGVQFPHAPLIYKGINNFLINSNN